MIDEEVIFGLVQTAQEQQAAVEKAMRGMELQRGELYAAIAQLKKVQASVAAEARSGALQGISSIGAELNKSLAVEVDKARKTLGDITAELNSDAAWMKWRWIIGIFVAGMALGFLTCWAMWGRDAHDAAQRLDAIEQTIQQMQVQQAAPAKLEPKNHSAKPRGQSR